MKIDIGSEDYTHGFEDGIKGKRDRSESYGVNFGFKAGTNYAAGYRRGDEQSYRTTPARIAEEHRLELANIGVAL